MIQLEKICKQYTNHHHTVHAVDNVSFSVAPNERVGIAGGSGSGKSTLLRLIAMLEKPTSGSLRLFGEDVTSIQNHTEIYRSMQMMFQNPLAVIPPRMNLEAFLLEPYINYGLMDEPLGALDALTRINLQDEISRICREEGKTVVFVTHDIEEAVVLADRVVVLAANPGRVQTIIPVNIIDRTDRTSAAFVNIRNHIFEQFQLAKEDKIEFYI